jgi:Family of unknown function (DUF6502)
MTSSDARKHLLYALRQVLRPIVRILIRAGIRFDELSELARGVYIESAIRDGVDRGGTPTRERIALATGVTQQQVDHYIENEGELPVAEPTLARVAAQVLQKWHKDSDYLAADDTPSELEFEASSARSFSRLVRELDPAAKPGMVLAELLRAGAVSYGDEMRLRAVSRSLIPPETHAYRIECFGEAVGRLAETLEYNFNPANADNKRLERFVAIDKGLPYRAVPDFQSFAKKRADQLLKELDDWLAPYSNTITDGFSPRVGTGVHLFIFLDTPSTAEESLCHLVQGPRKSGRLGV